MVSHHPTSFGGPGYCAGGNKMDLVCHVILQYHMTKASNKFMSGRELRKISHHRAQCGDHRHCGSEDKMVLVCQMIWQDHVTKA